MPEQIVVEIVLGTSTKQVLRELRVNSGATIADVIEFSGIENEFPELDIALLDAGVWGKVRPRSHRVREGDRIELYRPLQIDPREARRQQALAGRTMGQAPGSPKDPD